jgi:hypothetical protein
MLASFPSIHSGDTAPDGSSILVPPTAFHAFLPSSDAVTQSFDGLTTSSSGPPFLNPPAPSRTFDFASLLSPPSDIASGLGSVPSSSSGSSSLEQENAPPVKKSRSTKKTPKDSKKLQATELLEEEEAKQDTELNRQAIEEDKRRRNTAASGTAVSLLFW